MENKEKIKEEMKLQFEAGNLKISEDELEEEQFYPQFIIKANLPDAKKLELIRMIYREETAKAIFEEIEKKEKIKEEVRK